MKRLLIILVSLVLFQTAYAIPEVVYYYKNCNGIRTLIGRDPTVNQAISYQIHEITKCIDICQSCKLEIAVGYDFGGLYQHSDWIFENNINTGILYGTNSSGFPIDIIGKRVNDDKSYISFDLSELSTNVNYINILLQNTPIQLSKTAIFSCFRIKPANIKDNIQVDNKIICKGDCLDIGSLVSPNDKVNIVSYGCGSNPLVPNGFWGWTTLHGNKECFNDVGSFPICITVEDVCGEKKLQGNINVIDCGNGSNGLNCETCCNLMNNITASTIGNWFTGGNLILPSDIHGCGPLDVFIYFSDGTSIVARGSGLVNLGGKTITSICFVPALGCNSCAKCIQIGG